MHSSELKHHGIRGQKWGKKNGPPYPLKRIKKGSAKSSNDIYKTLSKYERQLVTARDDPPKNYTNKTEYGKYAVKSFLSVYGDISVSTFDIWYGEDKGSVNLVMMTRKGKKYRGKGHASSVVKAGMDYLGSSNFDKAIWDVKMDNIVSVKIAERYGFKKGKEFKEGWVTYEKQLRK